MTKYNYHIKYELPNGKVEDVTLTSTEKWTSPGELIIWENLVTDGYNTKEIEVVAFSVKEVIC